MKRILVVLMVILTLTSCDLANRSDGRTYSDLSIHDIQGCSHESRYAGEWVSGIQGVVTWKTADGFFMQELEPDDQECSSEGIFVFTDEYPSTIPGDLVDVDGTVNEFFPGEVDDANLSITEIHAENVQLLSTNNEFPEAAVIGETGRMPPDMIIEDDQMTSFDITGDGLDYFESMEGMRVQINQVLVVQPINQYRELFVIPMEMAGINSLSKNGALLSAEGDQNPERILIELPGTFKKKVQLGDVLSGPIIGIMSYEYGNYRILEVNNPIVESTAEHIVDDIGKLDDNGLRIAAYNINNYSRFDDDKVNTLADQIVNDLAAPDILVLQEVMDDSGQVDDGTTSASRNIDALIDAIYAEGEIPYDYYDPQLENNSSGGINGGNIRTVILFRSDRSLELVESGVDHYLKPSSAFKNCRIPVLVKFSFQGENNFYVIGVHLVSNNLNSPLFGILQPPQKPEESKRFAQAEWLSLLVGEVIRADPGTPILIAGDFNDSPYSKTLKVFTSSDMRNTADLIPEIERYSIIYEGNASLFDQILISNLLFNSVENAQVIHLNSFMMKDKQISDHDPYLIDIQF